MMMVNPLPPPSEEEKSKRVDLQHIELQLSAKDLTFLFSGFATLLAFIGAGFITFNNEVCKPAMNLNLQEIKQIQIELQQIKEKINERKS
jgi:hypothetical protein